MSVEEKKKIVEIVGDRKLPIQRNATLDTAMAEDDDDDMTVGTNNTSSGASARSDGLIAACEDQAMPALPYQAGSWGPAKAEVLIEKDFRSWHV